MNERLRRGTVPVSIWLLTVLVVGGATFLTINRAGQDVGTPSALHPEALIEATHTPKQTGTSTQPNLPTSKTARAPASPTQARPTSTLSRVQPAPLPTQPANPTVPSATKTFTSAGGTVIASCSSGQLHLNSVTPRDGWAVRHETSEVEAEVKFQHTAGEREIELKFSCRDGYPVVHAEAD